MKVSIVIPVYFNQDNLEPLYADLKEKVLDVIDYDYEIVMVNDGSKDNSYEVMKSLAQKDSKLKIISLSRNFGSHSAILCGLINSTGDCAVVKAADLQEPSELVVQMVESWKKGNNVVLAVREGRDEKKSQTFFSNLYYAMVRKTAFPSMPKMGFDVYLLDRKVIDVLAGFDEKNSALTGQILWSGFRTACVPYTRLARQIGKSRWTFKKKVRLVMDTLFSFSTLPIKFILFFGSFAFFASFAWGLCLIVMKIMGNIPISGWTAMMVFQLFSFGVTMLTLGILGEYLWRSFDASRNRPPFIIEDSNIDEKSRR